jgi:hypothetical protein
MRKITLPTTIIGSLLVILLQTGSVQAQASRTWVSGVGDDANPCSRTAPCKTFAGAISKTAAGGIINCIDPGGFGAVTITKSITIDCQGAVGGILAAGTNAVNVNAAGIIVNLRNLNIEGFGTGLVGVNFLQGAAVHIENCYIYGFRAGNAAGVRLSAGTTAELTVTNSTVSDNGIGTTTGGGVVIVPTSANGVAKVTLNNVRMENNSIGLVLQTTGTTSVFASQVYAKNSSINGSAGVGVRVNATAAGAFGTVFTEQTSITDNTGGGLQADGARAATVSAATVIAHNFGTGVAAVNGGTTFTFGTNMIEGNAAAGAFTNTTTFTRQ